MVAPGKRHRLPLRARDRVEADERLAQCAAPCPARSGGGVARIVTCWVTEIDPHGYNSCLLFVVESAVGWQHVRETRRAPDKENVENGGGRGK
jgi:hypothetical protein